MKTSLKTNLKTSCLTILALAGLGGSSAAFAASEALPQWSAHDARARPAAGVESAARHASLVEVPVDGGSIEPATASLLDLRRSLTLPPMVPSQAQPRSLASGDVTGDGIADLVCGYELDGAGVLVVYPGNIDSFFPRQPDALERKAIGRFVDSPFLPSAAEHASPVPADFVTVADFDGDGITDIVAAARGDAALYLFAGDGRSGLRAPRRIDLPGAVTALAAGEMNRPDGSRDLAVGVVGEGKSASILVFDSPNGALLASAETYGIPEVASSFVFGSLDAEPSLDLAAAAGRHLVIVHGRERTVAARSTKADAPIVGPSVEARRMRHAIVGLSVGNFLPGSTSAQTLAVLTDDGSVRYFDSGREARRESIGPIAHDGGAPASGSPFMLPATFREGQAGKVLIVGAGLPGAGARDMSASEDVLSATALRVPRTPVAVLAAQVNDDALPDLVLLTPGNPSPKVVMSLASQTFVVDCGDDDDDASLCDGACKSSGSDCCTLRSAMREANCTPELDTVVFSSGVAKVNVGNPLIFLYPVTVDGANNGSRTEIVGDELHSGAFSAYSESVFRSLLIHSFACAGITLSGNSNLVEDCWIGPDGAGGGSAPRNGFAIEILGGNSNTIGGTSAAARNVLPNNKILGVGIFGRSNDPANFNGIVGNYIGTDPTGTAALGNGGEDACGNSSVFSSGVNIGDGTDNVHEQYNTITGNLISGNLGAGVRMADAFSTAINNFVGTNVQGTGAIANQIGVELRGFGLGGNTIGGYQVSDRNLISGNTGEGVKILGACGNFVGCNKVYGNLIGTNVTGGVALGNGGGGVRLEANDHAEIGHASSAPGTPPGNVISGNAGDGISIVGGAVNRIVANLIGTNSSGTAALANTGSGIRLSSSAGDNNLGSDQVGDRNVISGNGAHGVEINSSSSNWVQGNYIGTNANGNAIVANIGNGVLITGTASAGSNIVGGMPSSAGAPPGNLISGNRQSGVLLSTTFAANNRVGGNAIGTNALGTATLSNWVNGVTIDNAQNNTIGFTSFTSGNSIGGNNHSTLTDGVEISGASASGNLIYGNGIGVSFPNRASGVRILNGASGNLVWFNTITKNAAGGVTIPAADSTRNSIRYNSISLNTGLGIDLGATGVALNDAGDGDTGANNLQNFPSVTSVTCDVNDNSTILGTLSSQQNTSYTIDLYDSSTGDPSGYGEGQTYLGSATCSNPGATCSFSLTYPGCSLRFVTGTATDPSGNTSEFSSVYWVPQ